MPLFSVGSPNREGDVIGGVAAGKLPVQLLEDPVDRDVFLPIHGLLRGPSQLAIDAIVAADLERDEVDPERPPQAARRDRPVDVLEPLRGHEPSPRRQWSQTFSPVLSVPAR
jgi:hypothetical protein